MLVGIVDDNKKYAEKLAEDIKLWGSEHGRSITPVIFTDAQIFSGQAEVRFDYDILFLDVSMPNVSGIDLARQIRKAHPYVPIVFISDYMQFSPLGYEVNAVRYLNKAASDFYEKLDECMNYTVKMWESFNVKAYVFKNKTGAMQIPYTDIVYFEVRNHCIHIFTTSGEHTLWRSMKELLTELPEFFVRTHRSYIANIYHMQSILPNEIVMTGNVRIPLSDNFKAHVADIFSELK